MDFFKYNYNILLVLPKLNVNLFYSQPLKIVGFYGDGYLEHAAFTLRKIQSVLSFSFRTMQDAAILLLSTFEGHEDRMSDHFKETTNVRLIITSFNFSYIKNHYN